jgi:hypothetical protein
MPITPFHFGPGLLLKSLLPRMSFCAFAGVNVLIDLESGWNLYRGRFPVHAFFHTLVGASLVIVPGTALTVGGLHLLRRWFRAGINIRWRDCLFGAALGAWSHVALDAIMHSDAKPLAPWRDGNPLLGAVSMRNLHYGCLVAALLGIVLLLRPKAQKHQ